MKYTYPAYDIYSKIAKKLIYMYIDILSNIRTIYFERSEVVKVIWTV